MAKKNENNCSSNTVLVDAELLGQGLKTAFTGISMIFDSLGASGAADRIKEAQEVQPAVADSAPAVKTDESDVTDKPAQPQEEVAEELPFDEKPGKSSEPDKSAEDKPEESATASAQSITIDDITKVIVAKIKKKRDNNAKIGSLLKTYGVDKVSSLPPEKYEAFLTDISQL